jgi:uncharacterized protein YgiM (DUF1202 family)
MIKKTLITVGLLAVSSLATWANQVVNGPQGWTYLRQGPSSNSPILAKLNNGQTLQIVSSTGQWYKVQMDDGTIGFVYGNTLVNGGVTASAARAAMAAHPMTSNDPQIRLQQALQQDEDFQARMDKHFAEVREARAQEEARTAKAEQERQIQAAQEQAEYEAKRLAETGQREGVNAAISNPCMTPEELEQYAKTTARGRITNWDAYFDAYREAYNARAPQALEQRKANEERRQQQQAAAQERLAKVTGAHSDDPEAKQESYQKGFQWGRNVATSGRNSNGGPASGMPTSVAKKLAPMYGLYCNPPAADFPSFVQGFLDAIDQFEGLTPM